MKFNKTGIIEALKELARIAVLGAVSALASYLTTVLASLSPDSAYALVLALVLRLADKYVHTSTGTKAKGILPF